MVPLHCKQHVCNWDTLFRKKTRIIVCTKTLSGTETVCILIISDRNLHVIHSWNCHDHISNIHTICQKLKTIIQKIIYILYSTIHVKVRGRTILRVWGSFYCCIDCKMVCAWNTHTHKTVTRNAYRQSLTLEKTESANDRENRKCNQDWTIQIHR